MSFALFLVFMIAIRTIYNIQTVIMSDNMSSRRKEYGQCE